LKRAALLTFLLIPGLAHAQIDTVSVSATGGRSERTWHGQADVRALNIELGHALSPRSDVAFVLAPMTVVQPRSWFGDEFGDGEEDVRAISASLLLRRRLNTDSSRLQFYGEAAMGPMWSDKPIPAATSRFNFVTQLGAGIVLLPRARVPLVAGYRFLHVSNGGYSPRNPGLNISSIVMGVRVGR
jgi:hypothetical protein